MLVQTLTCQPIPQARNAVRERGMTLGFGYSAKADAGLGVWIFTAQYYTFYFHSYQYVTLLLGYFFLMQFVPHCPMSNLLFS
jgi:hypothetical protein